MFGWGMKVKGKIEKGKIVWGKKKSRKWGDCFSYLAQVKVK